MRLISWNISDAGKKPLQRDLKIANLVFAICSLIGLFHPFFSPLDLFNHFRPQALVGTFILLLAAFYLKDRISIILAFATAFLNIGLMAERLHHTAGIPALGAGQSEMTIISANVLTSNQNRQAVIDTILEQNPDIVILSETNAAWLNALRPIESRYPYIAHYPRPDNFGIAAYSKSAFSDQSRFLGSSALPLLVLRFAEFTIIGAHPVPPGSVESMESNKNYLNEVAALAVKEHKPLIVTGDLNSTLWSASFKPLIDSGLDRINPSGFAHTWPAGNFLYAMQIDHFLGKNLTAANFKVLSNIGSDHYPIRADIVLP